MKVIGDRKAMRAAEAATHWLMVNFDPASPASVARENRPLTELAAGLDPRGRVSMKQPVPSTVGPVQISGPTGYDMGSTQWVLLRYGTTVMGRNEDHRTSVTIDVGVGYGPVVSDSY
jgi:hypothetical protein